MEDSHYYWVGLQNTQFEVYNTCINPLIVTRYRRLAWTIPTTTGAAGRPGRGFNHIHIFFYCITLQEAGVDDSHYYWVGLQDAQVQG